MPGLADTTSLLSLFADPTRVRLMALLSAEELSVAEVTEVTGLSQSRVSTHLGKLREAGLLAPRRAGVSTFYRKSAAMPPAAERVWALLEQELDDATLRADRERRSVLLERRKLSWPDAVAGQMERHYSPGRTWEATARGFVGLMELGDVLDAGSGDGTLAALIAPQARTVTCLDRSETVLAAAEERLRELNIDNVRFEHADMLELPFEEASFDRVMLFNVLTYARDPERAIAESARVLRPGGSISLVTLRSHDARAVVEAYGHVVLGFEPGHVRRMFEAAGLIVSRCRVTSRERRKPYLEVISAFARKPQGHQHE